MPIGIYKHKPLSEEHKRNIGESNRGKTRSVELRRRQSEAMRRDFLDGKRKPLRYWLGKKRPNLHSIETRKRISESLKGRKMSEETRRKLSNVCRGEKGSGWRGGITPANERVRHSLEYRLWREAVFKRDNWTCVWCGVRNGSGKEIYLHADHIKPFADYPELRFAIDNGRTLCVGCHKKTGTFGWRLPNNRKKRRHLFF